MIDKSIINELLEKNDYNGIYMVLKEDIYNLVKNYLEKNNVDIKENASLASLIAKLEISFPEYSGLALLLNTVFLSEEFSKIESIEMLVSTYKQVITELT